MSPIAAPARASLRTRSSALAERIVVKGNCQGPNGIGAATDEKSNDPWNEKDLTTEGETRAGAATNKGHRGKRKKRWNRRYNLSAYRSVFRRGLSPLFGSTHKGVGSYVTSLVTSLTQL